MASTRKSERNAPKCACTPIRVTRRIGRGWPRHLSQALHTRVGKTRSPSPPRNFDMLWITAYVTGKPIGSASAGRAGTASSSEAIVASKRAWSWSTAARSCLSVLSYDDVWLVQ